MFTTIEDGHSETRYSEREYAEAIQVGRDEAREEYEGEILTLQLQNSVLLALLEKAEKSVTEHLNDGDCNALIYSWCPGCTEGSVPDRLNRGNCWLHATREYVEGKAELVEVG